MKYKTDKERKDVWKYINPILTTIDAEGITHIVSNPDYNPEFANIIRDLDSRKEVYTLEYTEPWKEKDGLTLGSFTYQGDEQFQLLYTKGHKSLGGGMAATLFEEVFHAKQFTDGKITFANVDGQWTAGTTADAVDEWEAKMFVIKSLGYKEEFFSGISTLKTQLGILAMFKNSKKQGVLYLSKGWNGLKTYKDDDGEKKVRPKFYDPPYKDRNVNQTYLGTIKERTFNSDYAAYPYKSSSNENEK